MDNAIQLNETSREYIFVGRNVELKGVVELVVRPSGDHRLKTADGRLHIVAPGWLAIHIVDPKADWTV